MQPQKPLLRSRTSQKMIEVKMDRYKPRDWDYQNIKHQIKPHFRLGKSKKRAINMSQRDFTIFKPPMSPAPTETYRRELKPAIFRSYILSQIATLPGAVKIEESKIKDDKNTKDRIKVVKNKNLCFLNKLMACYDSNVAFLPGSRKEEIKKDFALNKSHTSFNFKKSTRPKPKKEEEKKVKENVVSPLRYKIKRKFKREILKKEPKKEAVKKEETKKVEAKKEETKKEEVKKEEPKKEEVKKEETKKEEITKK